jgi:hypothetical protein
MKSLCFISTAPLIRSPPFLDLSPTSLNRFTLKIPASLYVSHPTRCSISNPSSSEELLNSNGGMSRASISVFGGTSLNNLKMQVGSPISLHSINPLAKLSLSDQAFLLLAFIVCTTSVAFTSLVITAIPTLVVSLHICLNSFASAIS